VNVLRDQVSAFGSAIAADRGARFQSHLQALETEALRLIADCEPQQAVSH
jgi:hypothetical protein